MPKIVGILEIRFSTGGQEWIFLTGNYAEGSAGDDLPAKMYPKIGDFLGYGEFISIR